MRSILLFQAAIKIARNMQCIHLKTSGSSVSKCKNTIIGKLKSVNVIFAKFISATISVQQFMLKFLFNWKSNCQSDQIGNQI